MSDEAATFKQDKAKESLHSLEKKLSQKWLRHKSVFTSKCSTLLHV